MTETPSRLLADIGGTNARFALATAADIVISKTYAVRQYPRLTDALQVFLHEECGGVPIAQAAFAVAGPVLGAVVPLTNSDWVCDKAALARELGVPEVAVVNDFEAVAWALLRLRDNDLTMLQKGLPAADQPMLVMGPGTGLGVAALVPCAGGFKAVATEAGHTRYAPANNDERKLVDRIGRQHIFVTAEHLISGPGLTNIYQALSETPDVAAVEPAAIVMRARDGVGQAREALNMFAAIFGSFASQTALTYAALGGVYLTGGVLQKIGADFAVDRFLQRFATNPKMAPLLQRIPVVRIDRDIPAFDGLQAMLTVMDQACGV